MAQTQPFVRSTVNNAMLDPLQGFDADVYVLDQGSGKQLMVGRFTSFQLTVRNATEPYLEFNQRIPRMLDGEYQFGWVLERGLIDTRILENVFGITSLYREQRLSRSPRMMISVELNAPELDEQTNDYTYDYSTELIVGGDDTSTTNVQARTKRRAQGTYRLTYAKVDSLTLGMMAGRSVIATRLEGLCEGAHYIDADGSKTTPGLYFPATYQRTKDLQDPEQYYATSTLPDWVTG